MRRWPPTSPRPRDSQVASRSDMAVPAVAAPVDAPNLVADVIPIDGAAELEIAVLRMHSKLVVLTEGNERLKTIGVVAVALVHDDPSQLRSTSCEANCRQLRSR